eukprot:11365513-Alexandrium_andersonii.AAC.1
MAAPRPVSWARRPSQRRWCQSTAVTPWPPRPPRPAPRRPRTSLRHPLRRRPTIEVDPFCTLGHNIS